MNKKIVLVKDLVISRKISQNEKQRKTHKELKQVEDGYETVLNTKLVHISKVALVIGNGIECKMEQFYIFGQKIGITVFT